MNEKQTDGICLSEAEIKLKKVEQQFRELLEFANRFANTTEHVSLEEDYNAWKKARGIE